VDKNNDINCESGGELVLIKLSMGLVYWSKGEIILYDESIIQKEDKKLKGS
jgi:hypothetical protein